MTTIDTYKLAKDILHSAAKEYDRNLSLFRPWQGRNDITERNISFRVAEAFKQSHKTGFVFMEVPFKKIHKGKQDNHIDCYMGTEHIGIVFEAKVAYNLSLLGYLFDDMNRIDAHKIPAQMVQKHKQTNHFITAVKIVVAETWNQNVYTWWTNANPTQKHTNTSKVPTRLQKSPLLQNPCWKLGSLLVGDYQSKCDRPDGNSSKLYWLYGICNCHL